MLPFTFPLNTFVFRLCNLKILFFNEYNEGDYALVDIFNEVL